MGCCASLLATRSSVKVHPAPVQNIGQVAGGCRQQNLTLNAAPPPAASPGQEPLHLPLPTTAAAIWSAVDSKLKGAAGSHYRKKAKTSANWETLYVYVASVYEDFAEVKESSASCSLQHTQQLHMQVPPWLVPP